MSRSEILIFRVKVGVVTYPGSNCDHDMRYALRLLGCEVVSLWHKDTTLPALDAVVLPGGFSYGDYLRSGVVASLSPITKEVVAFARSGGRVLGICNGFQILIEAGLIRGSLLANASGRFVSKYVCIKTDKEKTIYRIPVAHGEGRYYMDRETARNTQDQGLIAFRYTNPSGDDLKISDNPNGSIFDIAGVYNEKKNVLGMMPHPERAVGLGTCRDGETLFRSILPI